MVMVIAGAQRDLEALKPCPGRAKLKPPPRGFPVMISCDCGVRGMRYEMPGETRSRPAFTPSVHAGPSRGSFTLHAASFTPSVHSILQRSRALFTHLSTRSRAPFTHSVHAFTRSAHPFTRTGTPVRRTGRVSLPSATTTSASASASASAAGGSAHPAAPAALGGTCCPWTPHAVSALEHARFRGGFGGNRPHFRGESGPNPCSLAGANPSRARSFIVSSDIIRALLEGGGNREIERMRILPAYLPTEQPTRRSSKAPSDLRAVP